MVNLKVNGMDRIFDGDPDTPLLWYLRDILGLTGTKFGCGIALCGACTVHKNGEAIRSCVTPMSAAVGTEIRTIEDLGANGLHPVQEAWMQVNVQQDGTVFIVAHRSEMGTVIRTSLPLVVADELDADWKRVKVDQAIGDKRYGDQNTDGSQSVRRFYETMRECGAAARWMLIQAAAQQWNVPVSECSTEMHAVLHKATDRSLVYGDLASADARLRAPEEEELQLKQPSEWRYIG